MVRMQRLCLLVSSGGFEKAAECRQFLIAWCTLTWTFITWRWWVWLQQRIMFLMTDASTGSLCGIQLISALLLLSNIHTRCYITSGLNQSYSGCERLAKFQGDLLFSATKDYSGQLCAFIKDQGTWTRRVLPVSVCVFLVCVIPNSWCATVAEESLHHINMLHIFI